MTHVLPCPIPSPESSRSAMHVRWMIVGTLCAGLALTACRSAASTAEPPAPVESVTASGAVAADGPDCAIGPPARSPLNKVYYDNDGVVGTIYNEAVGPIWVKFSDQGETCRINKGQSAVYAVAEEGTLNIWADKNGGGYRTDIYVADRTFAGVLVKGPGPCSKTQSESEGGVGTKFVVGDSGVIGENLPYQNGREQAVREYTGVDSMYVDDWVRLDFRVSYLTSCPK